MQKIILIIVCFLFPIIPLADINPLVNLLIIGLLYDAKVVLALIIITVFAGIYALMAVFKFLFNGFRIRDLVGFVISTGILVAAFSAAKNRLKDIYKRPVKLLHSELNLIQDFKKIKNEALQARNNIITIKIAVQKLINSDKRILRLISRQKLS